MRKTLLVVRVLLGFLLIFATMVAAVHEITQTAGYRLPASSAGVLGMLLGHCLMVGLGVWLIGSGLRSISKANRKAL